MTEQQQGGMVSHSRPDSFQSKKNILVVDDFEATRALIRVQLADLNCDLDFAGDGEEALQKIAENRYDLVLMDIEMPRMDGHETLRLIRHSETAKRRPAVPVIALTAHSDMVQPESGKSQWTSVLHKPLTRTNLVERVSLYLNEGKQKMAAPTT